MSKMKRQHTAALKAKVAISAIKEKLTISQMVSRYKIHEKQIKIWKQEALDSIKYLFSRKAAKDKKKQEELVEKLYEQIGRLQIELSFLKKKIY